MKFKSKKQLEKHLNELYSDLFTEDDAVIAFRNTIELVNENRELKMQIKNPTEKRIRKLHQRRELGFLLRDIDPSGFNALFQSHRI
jgi:hypothetical protein